MIVINHANESDANANILTLQSKNGRTKKDSPNE